MTDRMGRESGEFREQFVLRAIYEVGHDPSTLANYLGMRRDYVMAVCIKHRKQAMKAARDFLNGERATVSIVDQFKGIGTAIREKFERRRALSFMKKKFGAQIRRTA